MNRCFYSAITFLTSFSLSAGFFHDYIAYDDLLIFPHQIAIADFICTGMSISNCNQHSSVFYVDEILWGKAPSTNIMIQCVDELDSLSLTTGSKYLIFAYTNNWWDEPLKNHNIGYFEASKLFLSDFLPATNLPQNRAVFSEYRIMDSARSAINFNKFNMNGTNYWNSTRSFITNFLNITRIQHDEVLAFRNLDSILKNPVNHNYYPRWLRKEFAKYWFLRYNGVGSSRP